MRHTKTYPIINNSDTSKFPGYVHLKSTFKMLTLVWQTENLRAGGLPEVRPARHHGPHHRHHRSRHQRYSQGIKALGFDERKIKPLTSKVLMYSIVQLLRSSFLSKEAASAKRRKEKERSTCISSVCRTRTVARASPSPHTR